MALDHTRDLKLGGFWDQVRLVMWGTTVSLFAEEEALQAELEELKHIGVEVQVCLRSADGYDVTDKIAKLNLELIYRGGSIY